MWCGWRDKQEGQLLWPSGQVWIFFQEKAKKVFCAMQAKQGFVFFLCWKLCQEKLTRIWFKFRSLTTCMVTKAAELQSKLCTLCKLRLNSRTVSVPLFTHTPNSSEPFTLKTLFFSWSLQDVTSIGCDVIMSWRTRTRRLQCETGVSC